MPMLQRRGRAQPEPEDDSLLQGTPEPTSRQQRESSVESDEDAEGAQDNSISQQNDDAHEQMVKKMIRLALACEYQRRPIRRADISEKVLGSEGRKFKDVFRLAQEQLRVVFGMEMTELPVREKITLQQRRAAQRAPASQSASNATKSWILTSILAPEFRTSDILRPPAAPTVEAESKYIAIYTLAVSLITLSGGTLKDAKMERYLKRIGMEDNTPVEGYEKTEKLLKRMERDGYIAKYKENTGTGDDETFWIVGPRGKVEVGEAGAKSLALHAYGQLNENDQADLERRIERSLAMNDKPPPPPPAPEGEGEQRRGRKRKSNVHDNEQNESADEDGDD